LTAPGRRIDCEEPGELLATPRQVEGITIDPRDPNHAVAVLDADDPARPAELLTLELAGFFC
jgi:hypothetical protein